MRVHRSLLLVLALLSSCALSHAAPASDHDAGVTSDVPVLDTFVPLDSSCITPLGPTGWVPRETGACLGLDEPGCATCHSRADGFDIRPRSGPPPVSTPPLMPGSCGLCP